MTTGGASGRGAVSIEAITPTVFFIEEAGALAQGVDVTVAADAAVTCQLAVTVDGATREHELGAVGEGSTTHRVYVPEVRETKAARGARAARFALLVDDEVVDEREEAWTPQRHWTVYLVQFAHFDPGYTDLPSNVMAEYLEFLDDVVAWCEQTADWPEAAKFRYVVEQSWIAWHYVNNRPPEMVERFAACCKSGQIEVTAFFANMISDLLGAEETARLLYPAFALKRRLGIPIRTAEHNDVPAMAWSLATALVEAGIKWFMPGIPDYYSSGYVGEKRAGPHRNFDDALVQPRDCPVAFRWEAQDGRDVLVYLHRQGCGGGVDTNLSELAGVLEKAGTEGYPYETCLYRLRGGHRDNSPPLFGFAETVKAWNERWAYPTLVMATDSMFFEAFEEELGEHAPLPRHRGHWPDTDYALGSTSTADDLGVNRAAKDMLAAGERFATIAAAVAGHEYPRGQIEAAYIDAIKFDEHAWGMSSHLGWPTGAHIREKGLYAHHAAASADDVLVKSVNVIADAISLADDASRDGVAGREAVARHVVVFNAVEAARTDVVEVPFAPLRPSGLPMHKVTPPEGDPRAPFWVNGTLVGRGQHELPAEWCEAGAPPMEVVDVETGEVVPHQIVHISDASFPRRFWAERHTLSQNGRQIESVLEFEAREVPSVGYRTYKVVVRDDAKPAKSAVRVDGVTIENEFYRVVLDEKTGAVASVYDKELDRELVDAGAEYGANELFARGAASGVIERVTDVTIEPVRRGPVAASLLVKGRLAGAPEVTQEVVLYAGIKRIDFFDRLLKDADGTRAYFVAFPFAARKPRFRFEVGPNVVRPVEDQFPGTTTDYYAARHWVEVRPGDGDWAVAWSAREAPMTQLGGNWPDYVSPAHHRARPHGFEHDFLADPAQYEKGHVFSYVAVNNFGTNCVVSQPGPLYTSYSITSARSNGSGGDALLHGAPRRHGEAFCMPLSYAIIEGPRKGALPAVNGFCTIDKANVALATIKRPEDGASTRAEDGASKQAEDARQSDGGDGLIVRLIETEGVETDVTVDVPFFQIAQAVETNLVEEGARPIDSDGTRFTLHMAPWHVATVKLKGKAG